MLIVILILLIVIYLKVTGFKVTLSKPTHSCQLRRRLCALCDNSTEVVIDPSREPLVGGLCRLCETLKPGDTIVNYGARLGGEYRRITRIERGAKNHVKYFYRVLV